MTGQSESSQNANDVMAQHNIDVTTNNSQLLIRSFNATTDESLAEFAFNKDNFTITKISDILLYKLIDGGNKQFAYSTSANSDGTWWLEDSNNNKMSWSSSIDTSQTYEVHFVIKDNGSFDSNQDVGIISDPQTIIEVDTVKSSSSSSSGGCMFNSNASFGLEWLLLLVFIIRLRIKSNS